ncbi:hypothetical protein HYQ46_010821 [Verticillium longisporum]|nr:hypothetical protein HYQ46_010821 [Verticillium longisporum]
MPIAHIGLAVPLALRDETLAFYVAALAPLGYKVLMRPTPNAIGLGLEMPITDFWITAIDIPSVNALSHVAFTADTRDQVDAFYKAGLASPGAKDNGAPGVREMYHPNYYAAFLIDPVGNNIELVCHAPPS